MALTQFRFATKSNSNQKEEREMALTRTRTQWTTPPRNTGKNIKRPVVHPTRLNQLNTSIMKVFMNKVAHQMENKGDVHAERETIKAGTASLSTRTRLTGAQATRTNNTRATQMPQRPNLATENHQRVLTRLSLVDSNLSERKVRATLLSVPKMTTTLLAAKELCFCQLEPLRICQTQLIVPPPLVALPTQSSCPLPPTI